MKITHKDWKKKETNDKFTILINKNGHELKVAHSALSPEHKKAIEALPLSEGGNIPKAPYQRSAGGMQNVKHPGTTPAGRELAARGEAARKRLSERPEAPAETPEEAGSRARKEFEEFQKAHQKYAKGGETRKPIHEMVRDRRIARDARSSHVDSLPEKTRAFPTRSDRNDLTHVVSPDTKQEGKWRYSYFSSDKKPLGHKEGMSHSEALHKAHESGADIHKELPEDYFARGGKAEKARIYGETGEPDPDSKEGSIHHAKQSEALDRFAKSRFGTEFSEARGKFYPHARINKERAKEGLPPLSAEDLDAHPDYEKSDPSSTARGATLYRAKEQKSNPKPDWHSGKLESQRHIGAKVHEIAHVGTGPMGTKLGDFQEWMDEGSKRAGGLKSPSGEKRAGAAKQIQEEIQPMARENPYRRRAGIPAHGRPQYTDPGYGARITPLETDESGKLKYENIDGETRAKGLKHQKGKHAGEYKEVAPMLHKYSQPRTSLDTHEQYGTRLHDKNTDEYSDLIAQSKNMSPENQQRLRDEDEHVLRHGPNGWVPSNSDNALINLRGQGRHEEAEHRLRNRGEDRFAKGGEVDDIEAIKEHLARGGKIHFDNPMSNSELADMHNMEHGHKHLHEFAQGGRAEEDHDLYEPEHVKGVHKPAFGRSKSIMGSATRGDYSYDEPHTNREIAHRQHDKVMAEMRSMKKPHLYARGGQTSNDRRSLENNNSYAYDSGLPCLNPNCKSHGKPHPNCKCYSYASGGEVGDICETGREHHPSCHYYKDGIVEVSQDDGMDRAPAEAQQSPEEIDALEEKQNASRENGPFADPSKYRDVQYDYQDLQDEQKKEAQNQRSPSADDTESSIKPYDSRQDQPQQQQQQQSSDPIREKAIANYHQMLSDSEVSPGMDAPQDTNADARFGPNGEMPKQPNTEIWNNAYALAQRQDTQDQIAAKAKAAAEVGRQQALGQMSGRQPSAPPRAGGNTDFKPDQQNPNDKNTPSFEEPEDIGGAKKYSEALTKRIVEPIDEIAQKQQEYSNAAAEKMKTTYEDTADKAKAERDAILKTNSDITDIVTAAAKVLNDPKSDMHAHNYFQNEDRSTFKKILAGVGLLFGGLGSGLTKQPNGAAAFIDEQIKRDVEAQKYNNEKKRNVITSLEALYPQMEVRGKIAEAVLHNTVAHEANKVANQLHTQAAHIANEQFQLDQGQKAANAIQEATVMQQAAKNNSGAAGGNQDSRDAAMQRALQMVPNNPFMKHMAEQYANQKAYGWNVPIVPQAFDKDDQAFLLNARMFEDASKEVQKYAKERGFFNDWKPWQKDRARNTLIPAMFSHMKSFPGSVGTYPERNKLEEAVRDPSQFLYSVMGGPDGLKTLRAGNKKRVYQMFTGHGADPKTVERALMGYNPPAATKQGPVPNTKR